MSTPSENAPKIELHRSLMPPDGDGNDRYSLDILNVTFREVEMIRIFALLLNVARTDPDPVVSLTVKY